MSRYATYSLYQGVVREKISNAKKIAIGVVASIGIAGAFSVPAFAAYGTQPGFTVSNEQTPCAGHGAFGAFGEHGDVTHDFGVNNPGSNGKPGADGQQTGLNNSGLCGNRQGNL